MELMTSWQFWVLLALALGIAEAVTLSFFLIWPALAALLVAILTLMVPDVSLIGQLVVFSVLTLITIVPGRRIVKQIMGQDHAKLLNERSEQLLGQTGTVASVADGQYRIKLGDTEWAGRSTDPLKSGDLVTVTEVNGIILHVHKA